MENKAYQVFVNLLTERNVTAYKVAKATGISTATITNWKKGKYVPKDEKLQKIADYFEVSLEYLKTGEQRDYYINEETAKMAQEILENRELRLLFDAARDAGPEKLSLTRQMLLAMKQKETGEMDDTGC